VDYTALQRTYCEEVESLRVCNEEMMRSADDMERRRRLEEHNIRSRAQRDAEQHAKYYQHLELKDRQSIDEMQSQVERTRTVGGDRIKSLGNNITEIMKRCQNIRRRKRCELDGLRSEVSLLKQKLRVLEDFAKNVMEDFGSTPVKDAPIEDLSPEYCGEASAAAAILSSSDATDLPRPSSASRSSSAKTASSGQVAKGLVRPRTSSRGRVPLSDTRQKPRPVPWPKGMRNSPYA